MYVCVSIHTTYLSDEKNASDPLKHAFHIVVSYLIWVMGVECQSSQRTLSARISEPLLQPHEITFKYMCVHNNALVFKVDSDHCG